MPNVPIANDNGISDVTSNGTICACPQPKLLLKFSLTMVCDLQPKFPTTCLPTGNLLDFDSRTLLKVY